MSDECEVLHTYGDGSKLIRTTIQWLLKLQIWKGNRILDREHVTMITDALKGDGTDIRSLDSGYRVIVYNEEDAAGTLVEQRYIIDGQHRITVIRDLITPIDNFPITIIEKTVAAEADAVEYFNKINSAKPIQYQEDPNLIVNRYITAIDKAFVPKKKKHKAIRTMKTKRPYVCVDDIRRELLKNIDSLKKVRPEIFVERLVTWNTRMLKETELESSLCEKEKIKDYSIKSTALEIQCAIGIQPGCKWISELLK